MLPGGLVSIAILLPNLLWMLWPGEAGRQPADGTNPTASRRRLMEIVEWVGRIATLVLPFFYRVQTQSLRQTLALVVMVLALLFYYAGWARYFARGRHHALLFEPLLRVPLPLAISPLIYFLAASVLFASWYMALATAILAVGHLSISYWDAGQVLDRS